jgi:predicted nucleotidyltransferase
MNRLEPVDVAQHVVATRFPNATAAFLAGSVLTSRRTETSDLDIVVVLPGPPAPFRETLRVHDWVVELFVQTPTSMEYYWNSEAEGWRSILLRMCADGHVLVNEGGAATDIQAEARKRLDVGPPPVPSEKLLWLRYSITDLLDDLRGATDSAELVFIASALLNATGELLLLSNNRWLGAGKSLARYLADLDPDLLDRLVGAQRALLANGNKDPLDRAVTEVLNRAGGPLTEGYRVAGVDPLRRDSP